MAPMDYKLLDKSTRKWSPSDYSWECPDCPSVMLHDGCIDPQVVDRMRARRMDECLAVMRAISAIAYKKEAPEEPGASGGWTQPRSAEVILLKDHANSVAPSSEECK
jgi:hypothetical protein